ncbi:hypothetical protein BBP40_000488 [Aspergillus hancockii]|nr:hypothetical protein BBP40_000488 [Aspergillus hancockii]
MHFKYTATILALATSISAQSNYLVMSCNTNSVACQVAGIACHNDNTPWACPVSMDMAESFSSTCRNINAYPEVRLSSANLEEAKAAAGCK